MFQTYSVKFSSWFNLPSMNSSNWNGPLLDPINVREKNSRFFQLEYVHPCFKLILWHFWVDFTYHQWTAAIGMIRYWTQSMLEKKIRVFFQLEYVHPCLKLILWHFWVDSTYHQWTAAMGMVCYWTQSILEKKIRVFSIEVCAPMFKTYPVTFLS